MKATALAAAAVLAAMPAAAQPPPVGWIGPLSHPSIVCDTSAQVESIVAAFGVSPGRGIEKYSEFFALKNSRREPTCAVTAVPVALAAEYTDLGVVTIGGQDLFGWILHIRNQVGEGFYLYLETRSEALKNTI